MSAGKKAAAEAALRFVREGSIVGIGTGSTVNFFIDALARDFGGGRIKGGVSSSNASTGRLQAHGIPVFDLNDVDSIDVYVDGADEANHARELIKGGGGALTREKIVAAVARQFVCIVDESKVVEALGKFPLPVEIIPMAQAHVVRRLVVLGGQPELRGGFISDNGNQILDVRGFTIRAPKEMERQINAIAGVVTVGLFAERPADIVIVGSDSGGVRQF
jgi:ribose 5-phosphate isomerase A